MSLDFQQVRSQVIQMGESALQRDSRLQEKRLEAEAVLAAHANEVDELRSKVERVASAYDKLVRTAKPVSEPLDVRAPLPESSPAATLIAADGSQIFPDRNAPVDFCLINAGAIRMTSTPGEAPQVFTRCNLLSGDALYTPTGMLTEARLALMRDFAERTYLAEIALDSPPPVITFTDGPLELWMSPHAEAEEWNEFQKQREKYMDVLDNLHFKGVTVSGYVDKPASDLVVRLLEIAATEESRLADIRSIRPFRGVRDLDLFKRMLAPGERSAIFALQARSADVYRGDLALHFFFLNVGRERRPSICRVDLPAWVAQNPEMLNALHFHLVQQCRWMGNQPYPYLLQRAHECAVVTMQEKDEVTRMLALELHRRGDGAGEWSNKQANKELAGRTRYKGWQR